MLELRGASPGLVDDPLLLDVAGAPPGSALAWRARLRDDDGFVWRAQAETSAGLLEAWAPAKRTAGTVMALRSLRPVDVDVRVEDPGGAAASRTITRSLLAEGVKVRRWKGDVAGTLNLPPVGGAGTALVIDARGAEATPAASAPLAAALLASRGVLVFLATGGRGAPRDVLAALPAPPSSVATRPAAEVPLPPGAGTAADPAAWDALLAGLDATPRRLAR
jgi:hypothetical protein